jgi:hypothetical protein
MSLNAVQASSTGRIMAQGGGRSMKKSASLFTQAPAERSTLDLAIRQLLALIIHRCTKSRAQIADGMSEMLGLRITVSMLNLWTAPSREASRFPCAFVDAFCRVTGDDSLRRFLLGQQLCGMLEVGESVVRVSRRLAERRSKDEEEKNGNGSCAR